jgi:hypothetical protein
MRDFLVLPPGAQLGDTVNVGRGIKQDGSWVDHKVSLVADEV